MHLSVDLEELERSVRHETVKGQDISFELVKSRMLTNIDDEPFTNFVVRRHQDARKQVLVGKHPLWETDDKQVFPEK